MLLFHFLGAQQKLLLSQLGFALQSIWELLSADSPISEHSQMCPWHQHQEPGAVKGKHNTAPKTLKITAEPRSADCQLNILPEKCQISSQRQNMLFIFPNEEFLVQTGGFAQRWAG